MYAIRWIWQQVLSVMGPALQAQFTVFWGFTFCFLVSMFYWYVDDPRFPLEQPWLLFQGMALSLAAFFGGRFLTRLPERQGTIGLRKGAMIAISTWVIAVIISASVFFMAGFPDPEHIEQYSLLRRCVDALYEAMSGFTTAGTTILPNVERFSHGVLMWRNFSHWIGGMGLLFMMVTLLRHFPVSRSPIINTEMESHILDTYDTECEVIQAGKRFFATYSFLSVILLVLLIISGHFFRIEKYERWYDNVYDSINVTASAMGTGGFATYNTSLGLYDSEHGNKIIGGVKNPVSEWIVALFMFFAGINILLFYRLIFERNTKVFFKNKELQAYTIFVVSITMLIWFILLRSNHEGESAMTLLRYSFFSVNTVVSTTGLAVYDFTQWPMAAKGLLFLCTFVGGCVGSTAGGVKIIRYMIARRYISRKLRNLVQGGRGVRFSIDGIAYDDSSAGLVVSNILLYLMIFLFVAIILMITENHLVIHGETDQAIDFTTAITASIANLGNIGPAVSFGVVNTGPTGNYNAFSVLGKLVMACAMLIGRIGVLPFVIIFMTKRGEHALKQRSEERRQGEEYPNNACEKSV